MTVYDLLNADASEVEEQRMIRAPGATTGDVLTVNADLTVSPAAVGGSLPDPITDPINSAVTDPNDVPLFIKLPAGFGAGGYAAILIFDENDFPVFEVDVDGNMTVQVPPTAAGGTFSILGDADGITSAGSLTVNPGGAAEDASLILKAPTGRSAGLQVTNADGSYRMVNAIAGISPGLSFYDAAPVPQQTAVPVTTAAIHAALVNLGLITA